MNVVQAFEAREIARLTEGKEIPQFRAGDSVRVHVKIVEGERERIQVYEGVCIARTNRGLGSSFRVRRVAASGSSERVFPLYSPLIRIECTRRGVVRRAKLYYLRELSRKKARIKERIVHTAKKSVSEA